MSDNKKPTEPILEDQLGLDKEDDIVEDSNLESHAPVELTDGMEKKTTDLRPWHKRPKVWLFLLLSVVVLIAVGLGFMAWRNRTLAQEYYSKNWRELIAASELVTTNAEQATYTSFGDVEKSLLDMQNKVNDSQATTQKMPELLGDKTTKVEYLKGLDQLDKYVEIAKDQAANLKDVDEAQLNELSSVATATKLALEDVQKQISYLQGFYPDDFFKLNERYATVTEAYQTAQDEEKAKQDAQKSQEDQAKQDKANAEEAVSLWTQAYIAGNVAEMRKYMTDAFAAEYNFSDVTSSSRQYNYPTTYRRVNTDKKGDQYEVIETITFVSKSDYSADTTYTQTYAYLVSQNSSTKQWAVNSQRYQQKCLTDIGFTGIIQFDMSQVSEEKIAHVARLARIAFSDDDARATTQGVGQILHLVDAMQATQTDNVEPTSQVTGLQDVLREDVVKPSSVNPERLLQSAPRHENGYIVVKRVLG